MKELNETLIPEVEIGIPVFSSHDARECVKTLKEKRKTDFHGKY